MPPPPPLPSCDGPHHFRGHTRLGNDGPVEVMHPKVAGRPGEAGLMSVARLEGEIAAVSAAISPVFGGGIGESAHAIRKRSASLPRGSECP